MVGPTMKVGFEVAGQVKESDGTRMAILPLPQESEVRWS